MSEAISSLCVINKITERGEKKEGRVSAQSGIVLLKVNFRKCKITDLFNTLSVSKERRVNPVLPPGEEASSQPPSAPPCPLHTRTCSCFC